MAFTKPLNEYRAPTQSASRPCGSCQGAGGRVEDTSSNGVTRRTWHSCSSCRGSGVAQ